MQHTNLCELLGDPCPGPWEIEMAFSLSLCQLVLEVCTLVFYCM